MFRVECVNIIMCARMGLVFRVECVYIIMCARVGFVFRVESVYIIMCSRVGLVFRVECVYIIMCASNNLWLLIVLAFVGLQIKTVLNWDAHKHTLNLINVYLPY